MAEGGVSLQATNLAARRLGTRPVFYLRYLGHGGEQDSVHKSACCCVQDDQLVNWSGNKVRVMDRWQRRRSIPNNGLGLANRVSVMAGQ